MQHNALWRWVALHQPIGLVHSQLKTLPLTAGGPKDFDILDANRVPKAHFLAQWRRSETSSAANCAIDISNLALFRLCSDPNAGADSISVRAIPLQQ